MAMTTVSMMDVSLEVLNDPNYTYTSFPNVSENYDNISEDISFHYPRDNERDVSFRNNFIKVIFFTELVISILGAVGNGIVIWLLGFRIKRNPFSTYILNLAIADLGVLLSILVNTFPLCFTSVPSSYEIFIVSFYLALSTYSTSQFLLMAISVDRCAAVFLPLWHQCKRPPHLSTIICTLIWFLSFLLSSITYSLAFLNLNEGTMTDDSYQFIVNALLCLPVMTIATGALFIKVCLKAGQRQRGKLLTIVLLTLLFFLLFAFPLNVMKILSDHGYVPKYMKFVTALLACLNSTVNPVIYFLVGRRWKSRRRESMKMILQKAFKEEEGCTEETPVETQS